MVVIIILGIMFAMANKRREQKFAEGNLEYDPELMTGLEDVSDWENKAFRYVGKYFCTAVTLSRLITPVGKV
jgi:hypothetical protein